MTELLDPFGECLTDKRDVAIWRYINLERFLDLVCTQELHLARLDTFDDPWEASWPKSVIDQWTRNQFMTPKLDLALNYTGKLTKMFFASCWFTSEHEPAALWKLYAGKNGLAIRTTVGNLVDSIPVDIKLHFGFVRYLAYNENVKFQKIGTTQPPFLKRKSFEHEREFRVALFDSRADPDKRGYRIACNLQTLNPRLYLSPEADDFMISNVERLLQVFGVAGLKVCKSDLYDTRLY